MHKHQDLVKQNLNKKKSEMAVKERKGETSRGKREEQAAVGEESRGPGRARGARAGPSADGRRPGRQGAAAATPGEVAPWGRGASSGQSRGWRRRRVAAVAAGDVGGAGGGSVGRQWSEGRRRVGGTMEREIGEGIKVKRKQRRR